MNKFLRSVALVLTLCMVLGFLPAYAFATEDVVPAGDIGVNAGSGSGGGVNENDKFGWNIASSILSTGAARPFTDEAAYNAVASCVEIYVGQLASDVEVNEANIDAAVEAGTLKKMPIGGYSEPSLSSWTIGQVKAAGLIVVARHGLTFTSSSICCNDEYGFSCDTAAAGNAGNFNSAIESGVSKILVITPAMLAADNVFHRGRGSAWLMLCLGGEAQYNIIYNVRAGETASYVVNKTESLAVGADISAYVPEAPEGYVFSGWYSDADLTTPWVKPDTMPAKDIVVYGQFVSTGRQYVVDFGLPVSIKLSDIIYNFDDAVIEVPEAPAYGSAVVKDGILTYTPSAVLLGSDVVTLNVTYTDGSAVSFSVEFIPASTVNYEEGFASFTGSWTKGSPEYYEQALQAAGNADGNYGYDAKYAAETGMTNGTQAVSKTSGDKAELTFTGTGIDVYANCDTDTSTVAVLLYRADNSLVKMYQVDTSAVSGESAATAGQDTLSYNLPIVSVQDLDFGTYRIEILHTKAPSDTIAEFRLDGFRVYNPVADVTDYAADENAPDFVELRNSVLAGVNITESSASDPYNWSGSILEQVYNTEGTLKGALVLNGNAKVDATDLLNNGPKNELFLRSGESVSFTLASGVNAQIGLKAVNGSVKVVVNDEEFTITTSADMFYCENTKGNVTIVNNGKGILSVTKLKVFGAASAAEALAPISEELVTHALQTMGIIEWPKFENPFVDVKEDAWFFEAVMWAIKYGITNGVTPDQFMPGSSCSRGEIVTFLWRAAGSPEPQTDVNPFVDVEEGKYYYDAVLWAVENGITTGMDSTHFAPSDECTRAQVVTFLWRANGCESADAEVLFTDVKEGKWYSEAIEWAVENEITKGMSDTVFGVNDTCTRAQIVTFLYRANKK